MLILGKLKSSSVWLVAREYKKVLRDVLSAMIVIEQPTIAKCCNSRIVHGWRLVHCYIMQVFVISVRAVCGCEPMDLDGMAVHLYISDLLKHRYFQMRCYCRRFTSIRVLLPVPASVCCSVF